MTNPQPQPVVAPLTRAAIFLVVTVNPGDDSRTTVRAFCDDFPGLVRAVAFRDLEGYLSCVMGFGSSAWDRLFGSPRPAELHPFREIHAESRHAVATPGDECGPVQGAPESLVSGQFWMLKTCTTSICRGNRCPSRRRT